MRKNNLALGLLVVMAVSGALNAAHAQSPALPGAPGATPVVKAPLAVKAAPVAKLAPAAQPAVEANPAADAHPVPTPIHDKFTAIGHVQHFQNVQSYNTGYPAQNVQITPSFSMGAFPIQRGSMTSNQ
ncbi:MAG TPA: hypothetical protein V6C76_10225 [Drouetiella sp.]